MYEETNVRSRKKGKATKSQVNPYSYENEEEPTQNKYKNLGNNSLVKNK